MAGSADVTGIQYYTHGIGQPRAMADPEQAPIIGSVPSILGQAVDIAGSRTVTGTVTETSVYQLTIAANSMGTTGSLRVSFLWSMTNDASLKTIRVKFGNSAPMVVSSATQSIISMGCILHIQNMGAETSQEAHASLSQSVGTTTAALITSAIDTTEDQLLEVTLQLGDSTDTASLRRIAVELLRA